MSISIKERARAAFEKAEIAARRHWAALGVTATTALFAPMPALAATNDLLDNLKGLLQGGGTFLGGGMIVFGAISIGTNVSGASQGNGASISSGVAMVIGGAIIMAASIYFGTLDTSWATA